MYWISAGRAEPGRSAWPIKNVRHVLMLSVVTGNYLVRRVLRALFVIIYQDQGEANEVYCKRLRKSQPSRKIHQRIVRAMS